MTGAPHWSDRWRAPAAMQVTGWLFAAGSLCFLVAALAALDSQATWIDGTFFAGSIFFTAAAALQLLAAASVPHARRSGWGALAHPARWWEPHADWAAAATQFAGTILFNINTYNALDASLNAQQENLRVWVPDAVGSVCFLVASVAAVAVVQRRWVAWEPRDADWRIGWVNLAGSVAFGVSAIAAFDRSATGDLVSDRLANSATAWGAAFFLLGALLLVGEARATARRSSSSS